MKTKKIVFSFITTFILSINFLFSEELHNEFFVSAGVASKKDSEEEEKKLTATWGYAHTADFWNFDAGITMQEEELSATSSIYIFSNYLKSRSVQPGTTLGIIYNGHYGQNVLQRNAFVTTSFYVDIIPSKTRLTLFAGLGFNKSSNIKIEEDETDFSVYPIASLFLTQEIASMLKFNIGIASFSYFTYRDWLKPELFGNIEWNINSKVALTSEFRILYREYKKDKQLEYDGFNFSAGIKYAY